LFKKVKRCSTDRVARSLKSEITRPELPALADEGKKRGVKRRA